MATISTFELLIKRIAPLTGNAQVDAPFRRVVQGYFLTISNPNTRRVDFRIRARYPRLTTEGSNAGFVESERELVGGNNRNHIYTYDITGGPNNGQNEYESMRCRSTYAHYRTLITKNLSIEPGQTAAFKLLPEVTPDLLRLETPPLEIRGVLEIVQLRRFGIFNFKLAPVDLILTPEIRGTFLDNNYPGGVGLDFDQISYALPTCTGGACMNITESESPLILCPVPFDSRLSEKLENIPFQLDIQGRRYLGDEGVQKLDDVIKEFPEVEVNVQETRRQIEDVLNDERFSPLEIDGDSSPG